MAGGSVDSGRRTTLYFRDGSSDKVYEAEVVREGVGYVVNFAYGRRGAALKTGTKTPRPVPLEEAEAIYERLLGEKRAKGYAGGDAVQAEAAAVSPAGSEKPPVGTKSVAPKLDPAAKPAAPVGASTDGAAAGVSQGLRELERKALSMLRGYRAGAADFSLHFSARINPKRTVTLEWYRIHDPAAGPLTCDGREWVARPRSLGGFGDAISIGFDVPNAFERRRTKDRVAPPPRAPMAGQRKAFRSLIAEPDRWRRVVEEVNWRFYEENVRDSEDEGRHADVAGLDTPSDVWTLLRDLRITIPVQKGPAWWVEFTWECRWDAEHGHKIILRNGKPNYVGQQGGA